MRRALPWLGLFLLALSFVWLMRLLPPPTYLPTAAPSKAAPGRPEQVTVVLDPGHGGQDSGAICGAMLEKDLTLDVALRAEMILRAAGFATALTRDKDRYVSLADRTSLGNRTRNSLFVSIHFNDDVRATASGVETYYAVQAPATLPFFFSWFSFLQRAAPGPLTEKSETLAGFIQKSLVERTQAINRGVKPQQFYVIAHVRTPAALVEGGFITNKSDVTKLATTEYRQKIAAAISEGLHRYREAGRVSKPSATLATARPE
jgi:N-acetylmuramoyl-L-alanine amidase